MLETRVWVCTYPGTHRHAHNLHKPTTFALLHPSWWGFLLPPRDQQVHLSLICKAGRNHVAPAFAVACTLPGTQRDTVRG